jgi:hypothetical protein
LRLDVLVKGRVDFLRLHVVENCWKLNYF